MKLRYPIYIPSKSRYDTRLTVKALEEINLDYKIVVEPSQFAAYARVIDRSKILVLPRDDMKLFGSREWIMEHSIAEGHLRHWQLDDNISYFIRLNHNLKVRVSDGTIFKCAEDFTDRYENVAISGFNYDYLAKRKQKIPPFVLNTRVYSISLINNAIPFRHRRLYNDDTDICLQALKAGWCTILFNAFLAAKATTMTVRGGNTEELYLIKDGRLKMAQSLAEDHPDVVRINYKFHRWQHEVDYSSFKKNRLVLKQGISIEHKTNDYGMRLTKVETA